MYGIQAFSEKIFKKEFEKLMDFMNGFVGHIPFESGTDDADCGIETMTDFKGLLDIVSRLENETCVTSSLTTAKKQ